MSSIGKIGPASPPLDDLRVKWGRDCVSPDNAFSQTLSWAVNRHGQPASKTMPERASASAGPPGATAHAAHIPLSGAVVLQGSSSAEELQERAMRFRSYRQELLAANIANADTPDYKAIDIDLEGALKAGYTRIEDIPILYREPSQPSLDGNTVELDFERAEFAQNALRYQFTLGKVGDEYKEMQALFRNLTK